MSLVCIGGMIQHIVYAKAKSTSIKCLIQKTSKEFCGVASQTHLGWLSV